MLTINKRILIFSLSYFPLVGGAEIAVKEITDRISNIEFDMVTLRFDKSHPKFERIENVNVYRIDSFKTLFPIKACLYARKLHKARHYDVAWSIMAAYAGFAGLLFKFFNSKLPLILTLQEGDSLEHINKRVGILQPLFKKIFTKADKIQAISTFLAQWAQDVGYKGVVEVIPNGVDVARFSKNGHIEPHNGIVLITTSRLVEKNAVGDIIEALKFLPENVSLKILGTGPLEIDCKLKIKNWKLEGRVEMLGHVDHSEIPRYLHQSDIFIRPSVSEGFGSSFIEAMAAGLPVIATPVGGIVDFLKDPSNSSGQVATGLFCEVGNPESIAKQVKRLIADEPLRNKLIVNARKMVEEKYDWNLIAKEMKTGVFDPAIAGQVM